MSTRCNIVVEVLGKEKEIHLEKEIFIYHHCDGYPEGVGAELDTYLSSLESFDPEDIHSGILDLSDEYEDTSGIHGDIEYIYKILPIGGSCFIACYKCDGTIITDSRPVMNISYPKSGPKNLDKICQNCEYQEKGLCYNFNNISLSENWDRIKLKEVYLAESCEYFKEKENDKER